MIAHKRNAAAVLRVKMVLRLDLLQAIEHSCSAATRRDVALAAAALWLRAALWLAATGAPAPACASRWQSAAAEGAAWGSARKLLQ
jgi:hypothetical protein